MTATSKIVDTAIAGEPASAREYNWARRQNAQTFVLGVCHVDSLIEAFKSSQIIAIHTGREMDARMTPGFEQLTPRTRRNRRWKTCSFISTISLQFCNQIA